MKRGEESQKELLDPSHADYLCVTDGTARSRFGGTMTPQRPRPGNLSAMRAEKRQCVDKYPARLFPVQHEIQKLEGELNAFNERIAELENEGHRGHAMEVLKANAIDFARQIDELRCVLVESAPKDAPNGKVLNSRPKI
jgi:hypothetical protein